MSTEKEKKKFIRERIEMEHSVASAANDEIRQHVLAFLKDKKGYGDEDIEVNHEFSFTLDGKTCTTSVDFIIKCGARRFMAIKCAAASLESRDRHIVAFSRVVDGRMIPVSVVTNFTYSRVIETATGSLISEDLDYIPKKEDAPAADKTFAAGACPTERLEKESRILAAFDGIKCAVQDI